MRTAACFLVIPCCLLLGCSGGDEPSDKAENKATAGDTDTAVDEPAEEVISLEPADLEKLASWDATSKASAKLTGLLTDIMAEVKDKESAANAIPKLKELAHKIAAVNRAEQALGDPSTDDRILVLKNLAEANKKFDEVYAPLMEKEELKAVVGEAIDDAYVGNVPE